MATLYVENVPDDLYEALRKRARGQRRSIAAEVLQLLEQNDVPCILSPGRTVRALVTASIG